MFVNSVHCTVLLPVVRRAGYGIAAQGEAGQLGTQVEKAHRIKARHSVAEKNRPQMLTILFLQIKQNFEI